MESSGENPLDKLEKLMLDLDEMTSAMAARVGKNHAEFVSSMFSITNAMATFQIMLRQMSSQESHPALDHMDDVVQEHLATVVRSFAIATIKQAKDWSTLSQPEQQHRFATYVAQLQNDTMMLANKQAKP
jgi:hypothetical protein